MKDELLFATALTERGQGALFNVQKQINLRLKYHQLAYFVGKTTAAYWLAISESARNNNERSAILTKLAPGRIADAIRHMHDSKYAPLTDIVLDGNVITGKWMNYPWTLVVISYEK